MKNDGRFWISPTEVMTLDQVRELVAKAVLRGWLTLPRMIETGEKETNYDYLSPNQTRDNPYERQ